MIELKNKEDKLLKDFTFIDLFAGMGGFHLALSSFGAKCVFASEWNEEAKKVYENNFKIKPSGDITKINEKDVPEHDILCGGFPCQAFSISGKQLGFEDSRGTLFFDVARIIKEKKPKVVFLENVKNFETHDEGKTLKVVQNTIEELGYSFFYKVLNPIDFGVPQKRERIYIVAFRNDLNIKDFQFPNKIKSFLTVEDFLLPDTEKDIESLYVQRNDIVINKEVSEPSANAIRVGQINSGRQGERIYSAKGASITFSAYGGGVFAKTGGYLINGKVRRLHERECARIMGYPDSYMLSTSKNQAYQQLGNSVIVNVLQLIVKEIGKVIKNKS